MPHVAVDARFRYLTDDETHERAKILLAEINFECDRTENFDIQIANGASRTVKPQDFFAVRVSGMVLVSDYPLYIYQAHTGILADPLGVKAKFFAIMQSDADTLITLNDITLTNSSGFVATVQVMMVGL